MAWRRTGDKSLSEAMMVSLRTHICVTRPQWVNWLCAKETQIFMPYPDESFHLESQNSRIHLCWKVCVGCLGNYSYCGNKSRLHLNLWFITDMHWAIDLYIIGFFFSKYVCIARISCFVMQLDFACYFICQEERERERLRERQRRERLMREQERRQQVQLVREKQHQREIARRQHEEEIRLQRERERLR